MFDLLRIAQPALITSVRSGKKYAAVYYVTTNTETGVHWYLAVETNEGNQYLSDTPCHLVASKDLVR